MMPNIGNLVKQAKEMQTKLLAMQERIAKMEISGQTAGGMVKVIISGKGELKQVKLDKSVVNPDDIEMLEDLIIAAYQNAKKDADKKVEDESKGMNLPAGLNLPF